MADRREKYMKLHLMKSSFNEKYVFTNDAEVFI